MWGETSAKSGDGVSEIFTEIGASCRASDSTYAIFTSLSSQETPEDCSSVGKSTWWTGCCCSDWC